MPVLVYDIVYVKMFGKNFLPNVFHDDAVLFDYFFGFIFIKPYFYVYNIHILYSKVNMLPKMSLSPEAFDVFDKGVFQID